MNTLPLPKLAPLILAGFCTNKHALHCNKDKDGLSQEDGGGNNDDDDDDDDDDDEASSKQAEVDDFKTVSFLNLI